MSEGGAAAVMRRPTHSAHRGSSPGGCSPPPLIVGGLIEVSKPSDNPKGASGSGGLPVPCAASSSMFARRHLETDASLHTRTPPLGQPGALGRERSRNAGAHYTPPCRWVCVSDAAMA